jgi:hypothetical protein
MIFWPSYVASYEESVMPMAVFVKDASCYGHPHAISEYATRRLEGESLSSNKMQKVKLSFDVILRHLNPYLAVTVYFTKIHFRSNLQLLLWPLKPYAMSSWSLDS